MAHGDYIVLYDITEDGKSTAIDSLTEFDFGPLRDYYFYKQSYWQKKIISSTSNKMLVEFRSVDVHERDGFSASIHYSPLPSKECEAGLDMIKKTIQSPNYPDFYFNNMTCKWLISVPQGFYITLKFLEFDVGFFWLFQYLIHFLNIYIWFFYYSWKILMTFLVYITEAVIIQNW